MVSVNKIHLSISLNFILRQVGLSLLLLFGLFLFSFSQGFLFGTSLVGRCIYSSTYFTHETFHLDQMVNTHGHSVEHITLTLRLLTDGFSQLLSDSSFLIHINVSGLTFHYGDLDGEHLLELGVEYIPHFFHLLVVKDVYRPLTDADTGLGDRDILG
jgi:hypothetical protein